MFMERVTARILLQTFIIFSFLYPGLSFLCYVAAIYFLTNLFFGILYFICGVNALGDGPSTGIERLVIVFF